MAVRGNIGDERVCLRNVLHVSGDFPIHTSTRQTRIGAIPYAGSFFPKIAISHLMPLIDE